MIFKCFLKPSAILESPGMVNGQQLFWSNVKDLSTSLLQLVDNNGLQTTLTIFFGLRAVPKIFKIISVITFQLYIGAGDTWDLSVFHPFSYSCEEKKWLDVFINILQATNKCYETQPQVREE